MPSVNALLEDIRFSYILLHMKQIILLIAIVLLLTACTKPARKTSGNTTQTSLSNMAVDRQIKESDSTGTERTEIRQADTLSLQEDSIIRHPSHSIYGEWFTPHAAQFCIIFRQDSTFVFRLFNDDESDASGYFTIKKKKVTLHFEDGRKLVLNYSNPWDDDQSGQWYLWKGKLRRFQYYLVKAYTETNDKQPVRHSNESDTTSNG